MKKSEINKHSPLIPELVPLVEGKKEVRIADIGSGPFLTIGDVVEGVDVRVYPMDSNRASYEAFWKEFGGEPMFPVDIQNMEKLTCENDFFDITVSMNALDHTRDALSAVKEMIRVTKPGGWVYIKCWLDQMDTGYRHFWNAKEDGKFFSKNSSFDLKDLGFDITYTDTGGERRYSYIVAKLKKQ